MTVTELQKALKTKETTSKELTEKCLKSIEENTGINAVVHINENALQMAKLSDERIERGETSPLLGIPTLIKDNICSEGDITSCCSKMLSDYRPPYDATAWSKLKAEGAVLLGKTNMDEFAFGSTSENSCFGATKNPVNTEFVAGGSSGGAAAAVKAGFVPYALGSDTGGSVRIPASYCGVVGLKPTYGAVSRYGLIAYASSLDQIGVIANTVEDAETVFLKMQGKDGFDMTSLSHDYSGETFNLNNLKGRKIGVIDELTDYADTDVRTAVNNALERYRDLGCGIVHLNIPAIRKALPAYYIIACAECSSNLGRYDGVRYGHRAKVGDNEDISFKELVTRSRSEAFGQEVKKRIMLGTYVLSKGNYADFYEKAVALRHAIKEELDKCFSETDVIMTPTSPFAAPRIGERPGNDKMYLSDMCTVPANIAGLPAVSVPCGKDSNAMPVGLQIMGKAFSEKTVMAYAKYIEGAL